MESKTFYICVVIGVVSVVAAIATAIIWPTVDGNRTEREKMVACVNAGGEWVKNLNFSYDCKRGF